MLACTAHTPVTGDIITHSFLETTAIHGFPVSNRTDKGKTVVNKRGTITAQGQPVHARIRQVSQHGDLVCWRAIRGPQRKPTINTTGYCTAKLRITYTAPATDRYLAYTKTVTYKINESANTQNESAKPDLLSLDPRTSVHPRIEAEIFRATEN